MASNAFPRIGSEFISPPRKSFDHVEGQTPNEYSLGMQRRISNPNFGANKMEGGSYLDRLGHGGRNNSMAVAQTGATSGAALHTETGANTSMDHHTRKPSMQVFGSMQGGESAAYLHDRSGHHF